jgi:hypothetical protein
MLSTSERCGRAINDGIILFCPLGSKLPGGLIAVCKRAKKIANEDAMGLMVSGGDLTLVECDGVGSSNFPADAAKESIITVLNLLVNGERLSDALKAASLDLDQLFPAGDDSATTIAAARFFEADGTYYFQHGTLGNSRSILLQRPRASSSWQEVISSANETLVQMIHDVSLLLAQPANDQPATQGVRKSAFEGWKIAMRMYVRYLKKRDAARANQTEKLIKEVVAYAGQNERIAISRMHPRFAVWHNAGLFILSEREQRLHPTASMVLNSLDRQSHKTMLNDFSEPTLLKGGYTYLHLQLTDGYTDNFDLNETLDLLTGLNRAIECVNVLMAAAFLAMHDRELSGNLRVLLNSEEPFFLSEQERDLALKQLARRIGKIDNVTVQATMFSP